MILYHEPVVGVRLKEKEERMRYTGFDETSMISATKEIIIDRIAEVSCPNCHKTATNISVENNRLRFETCCDELRSIIMDKIRDGNW